MTAPRLSISDATAWTQAFLEREWRLTLPVAFALMGLPAIIVELFAPVAHGPQDLAIPLLSGMLAAIATIAGALAVSALALRPAISVAEALALAFRRLLVMIGATLIAGVGGGIVLALLAVIVTLASGAEQAMQPGHAGLLVSVMMLLMVAIAARLCMITPIVVVEPIGPMRALVRSWMLSRGHFWRLFALLMMVVMTSLIVSVAAQSVTGVIVWLIGRATGFDTLMRTIVAVVGALVNAVVSMLFAVLIAAIYRQLAASRAT
ncbi:MAG: hypothetical protein JOY99_11185 [Sphingomonadaceae bacterium]|nr:hypothetical protein [Sphingomonadaceae bacterium]